MEQIEEDVARALESNHNKCPLCGAELRSNIIKDAKDNVVTKAEVYCSDMMNCGHVLLQYRNNRIRETYSESKDTFMVNDQEVTKKDYEFWTGKILDTLYDANNAKKTCGELTQMIQGMGLPNWWFDAAEELMGIRFLPF